MYWLSAVILAVYSELAALRWISSVVTMLPRKVQMHMPQNRLMPSSASSRWRCFWVLLRRTLQPGTCRIVRDGHTQPHS